MDRSPSQENMKDKGENAEDVLICSENNTIHLSTTKLIREDGKRQIEHSLIIWIDWSLYCGFNTAALDRKQRELGEYQAKQLKVTTL
jgi:hypothetical protein